MKASSLLLLLTSASVIAMAAPPPSEPTVSVRLEKIAALRERDLEWQRELLKKNREAHLFDSELALAEARLDLARERNDPAAIVAELRHRVSLHESHVQGLKAMMVGGRADSSVSLEAEIALLHTQIDLARELAKADGPTKK